jgi:dGTPase
MRARLIAAEQLKGIRLFDEAQQMVRAESISDKVVRSTRTAKAIIETLVSDCIEESREQISLSGVKSADEVMALGHKLIGLTNENHGKLVEIEQFLLKNFYLHESLRGAEVNVRKWLGGLFEAFCRHTELMPGYFRRLAEREGLERTVCDYIAGMTDRFCLRMVETIEGKDSNRA